MKKVVFYSAIISVLATIFVSFFRKPPPHQEHKVFSMKVRDIESINSGGLSNVQGNFSQVINNAYNKGSVKDFILQHNRKLLEQESSVANLTNREINDIYWEVSIFSTLYDEIEYQTVVFSSSTHFPTYNCIVKYKRSRIEDSIISGKCAHETEQK